MPAAPDSGSRRPFYREYAPPADLAPYVRCLWRITADDAPPTPNRVCPDGCADIVLTGGSVVRAVGTMRTATVIPLAGRVELVGVRFHPGEALGFFDVPLTELTDRAVGLDELGWTNAGQLVDRLSNAVDGGDRRAVLEAALRARLVDARRRPTPPHLRGAVRLLEIADGAPRLDCVRRATGASERTLERLFAERVGLSPKAFGRVARFRRAIERLQHHPGGRYARIALEVGYADQAHFTREFKAFAGITPAAYAREWAAVGFVQYRSAGHG